MAKDIAKLKSWLESYIDEASKDEDTEFNRGKITGLRVAIALIDS